MTDFTVGDTLHFLFTTRSFSTGAPTTLAGTPVLSVYEDASLVQITTGVSIGVDHDGVTGLNLATIVATGANGFETGKNYAVVITTGTVGGVSVVGEVVASFSLGRSAAAVDLANATDGLGAIKAETALIVADTNELQTDDVPGLIAALNDLSAAQVNAEVVDALTVDTIAELAQAIPSATPTFAQAVMLLYMALRNKVDVTATLKEIHNDAGTVIAKKTLSDDGTTYSEAEMVSGP